MSEGILVKLRIVGSKGAQVARDFDRLPIRFGRDSENEVHLDDASVSRRHAEIYESDGKLFIRDLKSLNGLRLNGSMSLDAQIVPGDVVTIGIYEIIVNDPKETRTYFKAIGPTEELRLRPEGTEGVLEIIRAIDIDKVLRREGEDDGWPLNLRGEDSPEQYRRLHQAYSNLLVIMNLVSSIGNYSHPNQVVVQFVAALRKVFPLVEAVTVVEVTPDDTNPRVVHQDRGKAGAIGASQPSRTIVSRVVKEMRALYAVDARRDPRFQNSDSIHQRGVRSMMCAPLVARGVVVGAIYVENLTQPFCFSYFELNLLTVFAFHLAIAMETSRLLEERDRAFEKAAESVKVAKQDKVALILQYSQSEKKFRALFEQSALGAALVNLVTQRIEEVNDGLVKMLGYSRRQYAEMEYPKLFPFERRAASRVWLQTVREQGEGSSKVEMEVSTGERLIALQSCRALRVGDSEVMVVYFIDITDKERAEQETIRQLQRVTVLSDLSHALLTTKNQQAIHELLFEKVRAIAPVDEFVIAERSDDNEPLAIVYEARRTEGGGFDFSPGQVAFDPGDGAVQRVLATGESSIFPGPSALTLAIDEDPEPQGWSTLKVPLESANQVVGVVCVRSRGTRAFDSAHLDTVRAMAAQTALALSNAQAFEAIRKQEENLRQLSLQIMTAQETERGRISRELHDGVGQQLTAMKYILEGIRNAARSRDEDKLMNRIGEARELATQIISDLRGISLDLRPTMLDDLGLQPTLEWFVRQYIDRHEIPTELVCQVDEAQIPPAVATAVFRIIQEAMGNVAKHAQASQVQLTVRSDAEWVRATIQDDGIGFDATNLPQAQKTRGCSGMLNMKERAHFLGGDFRLETGPHKGTTLYVAIPIKESPC